ncbi:hypothetical protein ACLOJK_021757 [Asimina triloba]
MPTVVIRPKMCLANDGNYRELGWFSAWKHEDQLIDFQLPHGISEALSQKSVCTCTAIIKDVTVAASTLYYVKHMQVYEFLVQCSMVILLIKCVGYLLEIDGCSCIAVNGDVVAQGSQFSLKAVEVLTAQIDPDASYSPEDLRQFLYNTRWPYQFRKIGELVRQVDDDKIAANGLTNGENGEIAFGHGSGMRHPIPSPQRQLASDCIHLSAHAAGSSNNDRQQLVCSVRPIRPVSIHTASDISALVVSIVCLPSASAWIVARAATSDVVIGNPVARVASICSSAPNERQPSTSDALGPSARSVLKHSSTTGSDSSASAVSSSSAASNPSASTSSQICLPSRLKLDRQRRRTVELKNPSRPISPDLICYILRSRRLVAACVGVEEDDDIETQAAVDGDGSVRLRQSLDQNDEKKTLTGADRSPPQRPPAPGKETATHFYIATVFASSSPMKNCIGQRRKS